MEPYGTGMRKLAMPLLALLLAGVAFAAGGIQLQTNVRFEFTDCAAGGSSAQTVTDGTYLMRVTGEDTFLCYAATCAAGGEKYGAPFAMLVKICSDKFCGGAGTSVSCRSVGSTGDVILTRADALP